MSLAQISDTCFIFLLLLLLPLLYTPPPASIKNIYKKSWGGRSRSFNVLDNYCEFIYWAISRNIIIILNFYLLS